LGKQVPQVAVIWFQVNAAGVRQVLPGVMQVLPGMMQVLPVLLKSSAEKRFGSV